MKTVKITKTNREWLYDYAVYGETVDDTINRLLDDADLEVEPVVVDKITNINVSEDTLVRLKSLKNGNEPLQDVIVRALNAVNNKDGIKDEDS